MTKHISKFYRIGFIAMLALLLLLLFILPKSAFSYVENRQLQHELSWSWGSILDKSFSSQAEKFVADQFPWREQWVSLKAFAEQSRGMTVNNGILNGKQHYLFEPMEEPDWGEVEQYVDIVNQFINKFPQLHSTLLLAPTSVELYSQLLPAYATSYSQAETADFIKNRFTAKAAFIDGISLFQPLTDAEKPIYYRNDHHWSSYGAYYAYAAYMKALHIQPLTLEQFEATIVSTTFRGSYHTKGQFYGTVPDTIERYDSGYITSKVTIHDDGSTMNELYAPSFLSEKDQYNYYLGGVHALMTIENELTDKAVEAGHNFSIDSMLIIKDSYAHALIPFLSQHVKTIYVVDPRYYNGSLEQYVNEHDIDELLLVYNIPTFVKERSLINLKY